ncbi:hypothetical protein ACE6H2_020496 [Prunus campanulata]
MHMLLFNSSKADLQLQSDLPIYFPCSKAEAKMPLIIPLLLSLFSLCFTCTCFLYNSSNMYQLAPSEIHSWKASQLHSLCWVQSQLQLG